MEQNLFTLVNACFLPAYVWATTPEEFASCDPWINFPPFHSVYAENWPAEPANVFPSFAPRAFEADTFDPTQLVRTMTALDFNGRRRTCEEDCGYVCPHDYLNRPEELETLFV